MEIPATYLSDFELQTLRDGGDALTVRLIRDNVGLRTGFLGGWSEIEYVRAQRRGGWVLAAAGRVFAYAPLPVQRGKVIRMAFPVIDRTAEQRGMLFFLLCLQIIHAWHQAEGDEPVTLAIAFPKFMLPDKRVIDQHGLCWALPNLSIGKAPAGSAATGSWLKLEPALFPIIANDILNERMIGRALVAISGPAGKAEVVVPPDEEALGIEYRRMIVDFAKNLPGRRSGS